MADFHHQPASRPEETACLVKDPAYEFQSVAPSGKRNSRLMAIFVGKTEHGSRVDVGRVGDDQVELSGNRAGEEIRANKPDSPRKVVSHDIAASHIEGCSRKVCGGDRCSPKRERGEDRKAARAGANIEQPVHGRGACDPRPQALVQKLGNERARYDHPFIHVELVRSQPGFPEEVGERTARAHTLLDEPQGLPTLAYGQFMRERSAQSLVGDACYVRQQPG